MLKQLFQRLKCFMVKKKAKEVVQSITIDQVITSTKELEQYNELSMRNHVQNSVKTGIRYSR